jgi:hypothetical protein
MSGLEGSLTKDLKYWEIYNDMMVLNDGCFIPAIGFELPSSDLKSESELVGYNNVLSQMLRYATPEGEPLTLLLHWRRHTTTNSQLRRKLLKHSPQTASNTFTT